MVLPRLCFWSRAALRWYVCHAPHPQLARSEADRGGPERGQVTGVPDTGTGQAARYPGNSLQVLRYCRQKPPRILIPNIHSWPLGSKCWQGASAPISYGKLVVIGEGTYADISYGELVVIGEGTYADIS